MVGGGSHDVTKVSMPGSDYPCALPIPLSLPALGQGAGPHGLLYVGFITEVLAGGEEV